MLVGKTWRLQTRRRRGARARGRRSRRGSRQRRARISPRHPRRTRVARRSNPRHGRPSDPPPATSACAEAAPEGGDNNKRAEKVGGPGGERTLLRGADDLDAAHGGDTRGRGGAHGGAGDAGAGGEHNGGGGDSGHCRAEWRIGRFGVQSSGVGAFILRRHSTLAPAFSYEHFGENRFESSSPKGQ